ncbi:hypothetical protein TP41_19945, partial [Xanthomonas euvesicatoria pv. citrumelonis]
MGIIPPKESFTCPPLLQQDQPRTLPACKLRGHVGELCRQHTHGGFILPDGNPRFLCSQRLSAQRLFNDCRCFFRITFRTRKMTPDSGHLLVKSGRIQTQINDQIAYRFSHTGL